MLTENSRKGNAVLPLTRPAMFDWIVLLSSFSLSFIFPDFVSILVSPQFPFLMLGSLLFYTAGSWLKQLPLRERLNTPGYIIKDLPYKVFLVIGHWIIILMAFVLSRRALTILSGTDLSNKNNGWDWYMNVSLLLATFITWLVFRKQHKKKEVTYTAGFLFRREIVADVLLCVSVSFFSFVFWERGIMSLFGSRAPREIADIGFLFMMLAICFILFYLPLRYLFLIEDHGSRQTWHRFLLIFGFLMIRSLFILLSP